MNFKHGGDIKAFATQIGCGVDEVIDLSSNINFLKPEINFDFNSLDISAYPSYESLYDAIGKLYSVESSQMELFNGGSSAIFSLFRLFDTTTVNIYSPAYLEYKKAATALNYNIELINRFTELNKEVPEGSMVVFVNPSTPEGSFYPLEQLMDSWIKKNCTILIDESFLDFTNHKSSIEYLEKYDKLYILKSMTKFYSSAGIRLGVVLSSSANIEKLKASEPLWKISQFDSHYIQQALQDDNFAQISKAVNITNKEYLKQIFKNFKYTQHIIDSSANFILVQLKTIDAPAFQELLKPYKIMLRDCSNFDFLDSSFVRIAVKSQKDLETLEKSLEKIVR
jgi:threonine-phosphate decarboxylase